jgi:NTE family protein
MGGHGGIGLALSGGGFRATLFHVGSIQRLNELGYLHKLSEVTSVSGGSIAAAYLGLHWKNLKFDSNDVATNLDDVFVKPLRQFCGRTIDVGTIVAGIISPFHHPSELLASRYDKRLFQGATLQDLPTDDDGPRFTIYATSLQTGASVRFARPYMAEYHLGKIMSPTISLAKAVAASSAFPPPLCPVTFEMDADDWTELEGADLYSNRQLRSKMLLADGGVYDNLGLERLWDRYGTVLVSDAGAPLSIVEDSLWLKLSQIARTIRVLNIISGQTRALRMRRLIGDFKANKRKGAYWGIATKVANYELESIGLPGPLVTDSNITRSLGEMRTRLNSFDDLEQGRLINWGFALSDAAMRRHLLNNAARPDNLPVPETPI